MQLAKTVAEIVACYHEQLQLIEQELQASSTQVQRQRLQALQTREKQLIQQAVQAHQGNQGPTDLYLFFQVQVEGKDWVVRLRADQEGAVLSYDAEIYPCVTLHAQAV